MRPSILFALHYNTTIRREMLIVIRYRQSGFVTKMKKRRMYGGKFIDSILKRYKDHECCMMRQYIKMLNADNELILKHIDISEILMLITK